MSKKTLVKLAIVILFFATTNIWLISSHENAHIQIFAEYGIQSEIQYSLLNTKTVTTSGWKNLSQEDQRFVKGLQALNEINGYQTMILFNCLAVFTFLITNVFNDIKKEANK